MDTLSLRSDVIRSIKILSTFRCWGLLLRIICGLQIFISHHLCQTPKRGIHIRCLALRKWRTPLHERCRPYRGTSLIRNTPLLGPYSRTIPRVLWRSQGGGLFLMSEVPLYTGAGRVVRGAERVLAGVLALLAQAPLGADRRRMLRGEVLALI